MGLVGANCAVDSSTTTVAGEFISQRRISLRRWNSSLTAPRRSFAFCRICSILLAIFSVAPRLCDAQNLVWDPNNNQTDGSGNWNTTSPLWYSGSADTTWTNGDNAAFGFPSGTGGTITLTAPISVAGLAFNSDPGGFTFAGTGSQTLTIGSGGINVAGTAGAETFGSTLGIALGASQTWTNNSTTGTLAINSAVVSSDTQTLTIAGAGKTTIGGVLANASASQPLSLSVAGTGAVTLTVINTYTGKTTLGLGSNLTLDYTSQPGGATNIISGSSALVLDGGTLNWRAKSGVTDIQIFAGMTVNAGASTLNFATSGGGTLGGPLGLITRNAGGTLNFSIVNVPNTPLTTTTSNDTGGLLGAGITINNTDWATNSSKSGGTGSVVALAAGSYAQKNTVSTWSCRPEYYEHRCVFGIA